MIPPQHKNANIANFMLAMPVKIKKDPYNLQPWEVTPFTNWHLLSHLLNILRNK